MKLKEWLKERGMTAAEFARRVGVHRCTVFLWLHRRKEPKYRNYLKIKEITDGKVTYDEIF